MGWLSRFTSSPDVVVPQQYNSTEKLGESFNLLRHTVIEVSSAAIEAAKVLETRLHTTENRFFSTIDAMEDVIIIKDADGRWLTLNKYGQTLFGLTQLSHYRNKTDQEISVDYPRLTEVLTYCMKTDKETWAAGTSTRSLESITTDGKTILLDVIKTPVFDSSGNKKELIVVGRDVTEIFNSMNRRRAWSTALNQVSEAVLIVDRDRRIFFANDVFVKVFTDVDDYKDIVGCELEKCQPELATEYDEMWEKINANIPWTGDYHYQWDLSVMPVVSPTDPNTPIFSIFTFTIRNLALNKYSSTQEIFSGYNK